MYSSTIISCVSVVKKHEACVVHSCCQCVKHSVKAYQTDRASTNINFLHQQAKLMADSHSVYIQSSFCKRSMRYCTACCV